MFQVHRKVIQLYLCTYIIFEIIFHYRLFKILTVSETGRDLEAWASRGNGNSAALLLAAEFPRGIRDAGGGGSQGAAAPGGRRISGPQHPGAESHSEQGGCRYVCSEAVRLP